MSRNGGGLGNTHLTSGDEPHQSRRKDIVLVFITLLTALAYSEMVPPVRESLRAHGVIFVDFALFSIFFLTTMRFFIGAVLHLISLSLSGWLWFYDFFFIVIETVLMIFMGGFSTVAVSHGAGFGFIHLLAALSIVDVFWVVSQLVLARFKAFHRETVPVPWAILNTGFLLALLPLAFLNVDFYSVGALAWLLAVTLVIFVADMLFVDAYDLLGTGWKVNPLRRFIHWLPRWVRPKKLTT